VESSRHLAGEAKAGGGKLQSKFPPPPFINAIARADLSFNAVIIC